MDLINTFIFFIIVLLFFAIIPSYSQPIDYKKNIDSLHQGKKDSTKSKYEINKIDSNAKIINPQDTILIFPSRRHGSISIIPIKLFSEIKKQDLAYIDYTGFSDILLDKLPVYPLTLGTCGQFNQISLFGSSPHDIAFTYNSRPLNDIQYSSLNPEQIPPEFLEKAEILVGSDAIIFADNSAGALINLQEIRYNTKKPFMRMWFSQSGYNQISGDVLFSQNFRHDWNFTFGVRRTASDGRFTNSSFDDWNVRGILRWNTSDKTSFSLTENFVNHGTNLDGGVNKENSTDVYDEMSAGVNYNYLSERIFRHDLTLAFSSLLSNDSTSALSGSIYFTRQMTERIRPDSLVFDLSSSIYSYMSNYYGVNLKYEQNIFKIISLKAGGDVCNYFLEKNPYSQNINDLWTSAYGRAEITPIANIKLSGGLRISNFMGHQTFNAGAKIIYSLDSTMELYCDLSRSERLPSASEGLLLNKEKQYLALFGIKYKTELSSYNFGLFTRQIDTPILTQAVYDTNGVIFNTKSFNGDKSSISGAYFNFSTNMWKHINISSFIQSYFQQNIDGKSNIYPAIYAGISSYYEIIIGQSIMRLGFSGKIMTKKQSLYFVPFTRTYIESNTESGFMYNGLDLFLLARLGDAFIKLTYQNILSSGYYYVYLYPELDRNLRLSVSWSFLN